MKKNTNTQYIEQAIELAKKSNPEPNPKVGCIIVKNNKVIGSGYHKIYGKEHAEIIALKQAGIQAKNSTMHVTLEPCCTHGKTPPCVDAIIKAGVKKVVIGCRDINPKNKQGAKILEKNNIQVEILNHKEAFGLNKIYNKFITKKLPFIAIKSAVSLDGKIALNNGNSKWITNSKSRKKVHKLRSEFQAIITGASTIIKDDPRLTCGIKGGKDPIIIAVDSKLSSPTKSKVFNKNDTIVATTKYANKKKLELLKQRNIGILIVKDNRYQKNKLVDLVDLMKQLAKKGISNILVEAGPKLVSNLIKEKLVDKIYFFIAPKILGSNMSAVKNLNFQNMKEIIELKNINIEQFDNDIMIEGDII